ncbi:MAG: uroporphyrinogen-III C-methyltransferase [Gammaproteobacteria bacterium]
MTDKPTSAPTDQPKGGKQTKTVTSNQPESAKPEPAKQAPGAKGDTTPPPSAESPKRETSTPKARGGKGLRLALWFNLLLVVLLAAGGAGGYWLWQNYTQQFAAQQQALAALQQRVDAPDGLAAVATLSERLDTLAKQSTATQAELKTLAGNLSKLSKLAGRDQRAWTLAEVEYLLRVASRTLQITGNVHAASAALKAADDALFRLSDPKLIPVRRTIAGDLAQLQSYTPPDLVGTVLKLDALNARLKPLPVLAAEPPAAAQHAAAGAGQEAPSPSLSGFFKTAWDKIRQRVDIQHYENPLKGLPSPATEQRWLETLRLHLDTARRAALQQDQTAYRKALAGAVDWMQTHYRADAAAPLIAELKQLQQVDLNPRVPDITDALQQLKRLLAQEAAGS